MKAVLIQEHGGSDVLQYGETDDPQPACGEVVVRVRACALNHLDVHLRNGIPAYKIPLPHVLGCDVAGEIATVGDGVSGVEVGQSVVVNPGLNCGACGWCAAGEDSMCDEYGILGSKRWGGYAELVAVPAGNVLPLPEGLSFENAASVPLTFMTAWHMLITRAALKAGETVLMLGAGSGIGAAGVQIAKLCGAHVIGTVGTNEKLELAKALGADDVINHVETNDLSKDVKRLTDGRGADVVFEHVGEATFSASLKSLARKGRLVTCGSTTGPNAQFDIRFLFMRQFTILGSMMGTKSELLTILKLVGDGRLKPVVDRVFPLADAAEAQSVMEQRKLFGKLVLIP